MFDYRMAKSMREEQLRQAELHREARQARDSAGVRFGTGASKLVVAVVAGLMIAAVVTAALIVL